MKKLLAYLFIVGGIGVMVISTSEKSMKPISEKRDKMTGSFGIHRSTGGDLVRMSYLDNISKFIEPDVKEYKHPADTSHSNINLYLYGDSYIIFMPDSVYGPVNQVVRGRRDYTDLRYKLDPNKTNILILENGERFVRSLFRYPYLFDNVSASFKTANVVTPIPNLEKGNHSAGFFQHLFQYANINTLFNKKINQNLEYNLFNYNFLNVIRQLKAELNYNFFNRVSGDVVLSKDEKRLFLKSTVDEYGLYSTYEKTSQKELATIFKNIDIIYRHYKNEGFDEVYFSIVPNPATILQPENYNELIPRIEAWGREQKIPFISTYNIFKSSPRPESLYLLGDTHWSNKGAQLWVDLVNGILAEKARKDSSLSSDYH